MVFNLGSHLLRTACDSLDRCIYDVVYMTNHVVYHVGIDKCCYYFVYEQMTCTIKLKDYYHVVIILEKKTNSTLGLIIRMRLPN